jgi:hypothetical protein
MIVDAWANVPFAYPTPAGAVTNRSCAAWQKPSDSRARWEPSCDGRISDGLYAERIALFLYSLRCVERVPLNGRTLVRVLVVTFMLSASIATVHAQGAAWCLQSDAFEGDRSCGYATFEQCLADRNYLNGFCVQNSTFRAPEHRGRH